MKLYEQVWDRYAPTATFVKGLRKTMTQHDISQKRLAERAGYHPSHVSLWLRGLVKPQLATLLKLDEALDQLVENGG